MDAIEKLISGFYQSSVRVDWREFRAHGLGELCRHFGALGGAWWTRGADADGGEMTQLPQPFIDVSTLRGFTLKTAATPLAVPPPRGPGYVLVYEQGGPLSTVFLRFPDKAELPAAVAFGRAAGHLVEAGALALSLFINRDDWLHALGRANRGSAALVDAAGTVYAASPTFRTLLGDHSLELCGSRLPFELPEDALDADGGEFVHGPLHLRLARHGSLYLLHARRPLPLDSLSPREQEIARSLSDGKTLKSIARQYGIAVSTVANHTTRIYRKLSIFRREDLVEMIRARPLKR